MEPKIKQETKDIKIQSAIKAPPKELSKAIKETAKVKILREKGEKPDMFITAESKAVNDTLDDFEIKAQGITNYTVNKAYVGGKKLAQKKYQKLTKEKIADTMKQADCPIKDGPPALLCSKTESSVAKQQENPLKSTKLSREKKSSVRTAKEHIKMKKNKVSINQSKRQAQANATKQMKNEALKKMTAQVKRGVERLKQAVVAITKAVIRSVISLLGGMGGIIALVLLIGGAAAVIATPFGVFWSGEDTSPDTSNIPLAVAEINRNFTDKISQIENSVSADSVTYYHTPNGTNDLLIINWHEVVAVFACKVAGASQNATDVVTIDDSKIAMLKEVFWDMNDLSYTVETIRHSSTNEQGENDSWTETILHITLNSKTAQQMAEVYNFSSAQKQSLTEMLKPEYAQMLAELVGNFGTNLTLTDEQLRQMMKNIPEDLPEERKKILETAYSLVGKVGYFWGGKSYAIGWDNRWGQATKVTSEGSKTTGTTRPFGLDCSGFVDWVFNNAHSYLVGHGGGAATQYSYCTPISWGEALPGDLVFYPACTHVGIYAGIDENGKIMVIHCASGYNNVVVTGIEGFTMVARPYD